MDFKRQKGLIVLAANVAHRIAYPKISRLNLSITTRCNHRCQSCNIWKEQTKKEITAKDTAKILDNNNLLWVSITGGEPFLNHDIEEILTLCLQNTKLTNIISNGSKPEHIEKAVEQALKKSNNNLLAVHISLFGSPEIHDMLCGCPNSYSQIIETIGRLKKIRNSRLVIGLEHMLSSRNEGEWQYVSNLAKEMRIGLTYVIEQKARYYKNEDTHITIPAKPAPDFQGGIIDIFKNMFLLKVYNHHKGCVAGQYSCFVMPDKNVYPCFFAIPNNPAFNLMENNYKLKDFNQSKEFISKCKGCWTPCESYTTMIFRPWHLLH